MPVNVRRAEAFRALHVPGRPFVLPNAWDAASARTLAALPSTAALGTTSAGIAWSLGRPDGELDPDAVTFEVVARVAAAVDVPVTADVEAGYGDVAGTVAGVLAAGAVGVNLEDGTGDPAAPLRPVDEHAAIVAAARAAADDAGVPLFVNARVDAWWAGAGDPTDRVDHAIERGRLYVAAGADGVSPPALVDADTIRALAAAVGAPLNVLASPGLPRWPTSPPSASHASRRDRARTARRSRPPRRSSRASPATRRRRRPPTATSRSACRSRPIPRTVLPIGTVRASGAVCAVRVPSSGVRGSGSILVFDG